MTETTRKVALVTGSSRGLKTNTIAGGSLQTTAGTYTTAATANLPANDRHILAYLKTVLAKLGLEGTNHKFRHSFCTIAVLAGGLLAALLLGPCENLLLMAGRSGWSFLNNLAGLAVDGIWQYLADRQGPARSRAPAAVTPSGWRCARPVHGSWRAPRRA